MRMKIQARRKEKRRGPRRNCFVFCALLLVAGIASPVHRTLAQEVAWASGITEAVNDVTLSSPLAGIIAKRKFEEGQFVKAGESIIELDSRLEQLEMQRRKFMVDLKKTDMENSQK